MQNLSDAVKAMWEMRGGRGVRITKSLGGWTINIDQQPQRARGLVRTCALWKRINEETDSMLTVRPVGYGREPPDRSGHGPYVWAGDPFFAYPDYGKSIAEYRDFQPEMNDPPSPTKDTLFLHVQRDSWGHVAWFPSAVQSGDVHCVVRDTGTGFERTVMVQRVRLNENGDYRVVKREEIIDGETVLVDDVFTVMVPPGMWSRNFTALRLPLPHEWHVGANTLELYLDQGLTYVRQTTKFMLAPVDRGFPKTDCVFNTLLGG